MTFQPLLKPVDIVPANAPFSEEQRAWLSGFLAAALGALSPPASQPTGVPADLAGPILASNDDAPWHDPALPAPDRMKLAEGRQLPSRLMAAMAQQDCGQCGYNCADYANVLFQKKEERLNLCAPGGKETLRLLKSLAEEFGAGPVEAASVPAQALPSVETIAPPRGTCRENPAEAVLVSRRRLNAADSEKQTMHVEFDLTGSGLAYEVGDSFGVFPRNHLGLVDQIIAMLGCAHSREVNGRPLREVLAEDVSLGLAPDSLFELFSYILGGKAREKARALARGEDPDGDADRLDVLAVLQKFPDARPHPEAFVDVLEPLQPRLYSISSSPKATPDWLSLTVDAVHYVVGKRHRFGVASTYLSERAEPGERLHVYVQKAHGFALPDDPATPIIMVGPGTGVAPFRAFLQERRARGAHGRNWLFFGHQRQATDFFYREELQSMQAAGFLTRLSLAWSRDGDRKFYVQDRMLEVGADLWRWLQEGAHFYICGDAKRMARDVEAALVAIAAAQGGMSADEASLFVSGLKKAGRYQADVY
ncbi:sulfite reductase subunit alpha [Labrys neptuniae]